MKGAGQHDPGLFAAVENIWANSFGIIRDIFQLFILEVKLAGRSIAMILVLVIVTSLLLLSSWFLLVGALVTWLMTFNMNLIPSLLIVSAINLFIAVITGLFIARLAHNIDFKETRQQLQFKRDDHETIKQ